MAFLDEDELSPADAPGSRRYGSRADRQRQYMVRRVVALGAGVLVLILLLLGIRGCLDARKERGFENYVSDLTAIANEANQLASGFFERLENPPQNLTELTLEAEVASDRGTSEALLQRVQGLDTPDELADAQEDLVLSFELRRDAFAGIANALPTALGSEGRRDATQQIANQMRTFLAGDVLYRRARGKIRTVLEQEEIAGEVPQSSFLPDPPSQWLDPLEVSSTLSGIAGDAGVAPGVHGVALLSTTLNPGGAVLTAGGEATVTLDGPPELDVEVQNQGDSRENDVIVVYRLSGGSTSLDGEATIPRIQSGAIETVTLPFEEEPETGVALTLEVTVEPVPGEEITENNTATYTVTFE